MEDTDKRLRTSHAQLIQGKDVGDVFSLLHEFGEADFFEARSTVESYLHQSVPSLRRIALSVLILHWRLPEYRSVCEQMLIADEDAEVRSTAASCVASLLQGTRDPRAVRLLLDGLRAELTRDPSSSFLAIYYESLLRVLGHPWRHLLGGPDLHENDFDQKILA